MGLPNQVWRVVTVDSFDDGMNVRVSKLFESESSVELYAAIVGKRFPESKVEIQTSFVMEWRKRYV